MLKADRLPDFLIIGAAKSGTTWLSAQLARHPGLFLPPQEIHYFSQHYNRPIAWYASHFRHAEEQEIIGERSNTYLYWPGVPERIAREIYNPKLIAILRNPVERAYSGYCMQLARGAVGPQIEDYLDPASSSTESEKLLEQGLYARHIRRYLQCFRRGQLEIALYDDLWGDAESLVTGILGFLGVDASLLPCIDNRPRNQRRAQDYPRYVRKLVSAAIETEAGRAVVGRLRSSRLGALTRRWHGRRTIEYPPLTENLRDRLRDYYASDIAGLERLLGREIRW